MIDCKIIEQIAVLEDTGNGYTKELNLISWNNAAPKYDIRTWYNSEGERKMHKGVTLSEAEMQNLIKAMNERK